MRKFGLPFFAIWRISRLSSSGDPRSLRTTSAIAVQRKKKLRLKNFCSNCFIFPYCTRCTQRFRELVREDLLGPGLSPRPSAVHRKTHVRLSSHLPDNQNGSDC